MLLQATGEENIAEMKEESWDGSESYWIKFHNLEDK